MLSHVLFALLSTVQSDPIIVTDGVFKAPNGVRIELLGLADDEREVGPVYGVDGKPLGKAGVAEFVRYTRKKGYAKNSPHPRRPTTWVALFRVVGPLKEAREVDLPFTNDFAGAQYSPPEPEKGRPYRSVSASIRIRKSATHMDFPMTMPAGQYEEIAEFNEDGSTESEGFEFKIESGATGAFKATQKGTEEFSMDSYRGTALIPLKYQGHEFKLRASDQK